MKEAHAGMSLRVAKKLARELGVKVECIRRTGELRFVYGDKRVVHNARRKGASRTLTCMLRQVQQQQMEEASG